MVSVGSSGGDGGECSEADCLADLLGGDEESASQSRSPGPTPEVTATEAVGKTSPIPKEVSKSPPRTFRRQWTQRGGGARRLGHDLPCRSGWLGERAITRPGVCSVVLDAEGTGLTTVRHRRCRP